MDRIVLRVLTLGAPHDDVRVLAAAHYELGVTC